jgi:hypothetical protein
MSYKVKIDSDGDVRDYNILSIVIDGIVTKEYYDNGEPEGNLFTRDYDWIEEELERAYDKGFQDGTYNEILKRMNR